MATYTENYDLIKPDETDYYNVEDFNNNMDTLDAVMAAAETEMEGVGSKVDTVSGKVDTVQNGVNSLQTKVDAVQAGVTALASSPGSVVKSVQRVVYKNAASVSGGTVALTKTIDPAKAFVISERLYNRDEIFYEYDYTLSASQITITHGTYLASSLVLGFSIVEFY